MTLNKRQLKWERNVLIRHFQKLQTIGLPKPIKVAKNRQKFHDMVTRSVEVVKIGLHLERAILPVLPQNIASKPKPEKEKNNFKTENTI